MEQAELFMRRCIYLAELGAGRVAPNPMVGSVLVYDNQVLGEGFHEQYGDAHAEVNCIRDAEERFRTSNHSDNTFEKLLSLSTIYVSLEPCAHHGKTPPCADLIITKNIRKVVIGCRDPFPLVDGKGIDKLLAAGVEVTVGVLEQECRELNKRFFTFHAQNRPYIILKWAQSADAFIAAHADKRTMISNDITNRLVHKWRSEEAGILVGTTTAAADNPSLDNRLWTGNHPVRIVIDLHLRLDSTLKMFMKPGHTIVFNYIKEEKTVDIHFVQLPREQPVANAISDALFKLNIQSILVEGGALTLQHFIDQQLWDETRIITAETLLLGGGLHAPSLPGALLSQEYRAESDIHRIYRKELL